ncbi:MAG: ThuA domain-containing protein [Planctomycetota bacterium]
MGAVSNVTVLATSKEPVPKGSDDSSPQPIFWTSHYGKGRVFACVPGHFTWTFDDPYFRILLLRGMAWAAGESPYRFDALVTRGIPLK